MEKGKEKILLVDDEPSILNSLRIGLIDRGYLVETASTGREALNLMSVNEFSVGVFDIILPDISGLDLLRECLDIDPDLAVIMITGWAEIDAVIESMRSKAYSFLRKPFDISELEIEIRNALKHRLLQLENREYADTLKKLVEQRTSELLKSQGELKLEKEKLENVLKSIGAGLQVIDMEGNIVWTNPITLEWFGPSGYWHRLLQEQSPELDIPTIMNISYYDKAEADSQYFVLQCRDGKVREFQLYWYPVLNQAGKTIQAVKLILDVTEKNALRRELIQSEKLASIGEIAASLTHEINNPLGIILGFVQNIIADIDPQHKFYNNLKIVEEEIFKVAGVMGNLLEFTRQPVSKVQQVDIGEVWKRCRKFFDYMFKEKGINVVSQIPPGIKSVMGDPDLLHQAFVNIVLNSIQAMPKGGTFTFKCGMNFDAEENKEFLKIELIDTGSGILPEDLGKIFNPFFTKKGSKGTGLGLSNSRRIIVEQHFGKIQIQSVFGKGTTCIIQLPV